MRERCACRDRTSSRVAAPHARATSRLTAPSPFPAPRVTANSPPRPRRRLASPSACARRYVPTRARTASEARWVVFDFPSRVFPGARRPATAATREDTRVDRVDRSVHVRLRSVRSPPLPVPDRHRTKPLRGEGSRGEEARPIGPPRGSQVRLSPRRALVSFADPPSRRRRRTNGNASMPHPGSDHTTPKRRVVHRPNAPGGFEGARRLRAASADPADVRPSVPEQRTLEKSHSRNRVSGRSRRGGRKEVMTGTRAGATRG